LLPGDVTGVNFFNQKTQSFEFRPGPILSQIVLADEINRATPRTQSALLEGMQERQMTIDGETHLLPRPFLVLATQNPIELEGTFPLPEAQLDRFLMRVTIGYPTEEEENAILRRFKVDDPLEHLEPVTDPRTITELIAQVRAIHVAEAVQNYVVTVIRETRTHPEIDLGASPRAALALYRTAQARAAIAGRDFVLPDDVKFLAPYVLTHRIHISPQTRLRGRRPDEVISDLVNTIPVPVEH
jgi:MoxR-like ATPase